MRRSLPGIVTLCCCCLSLISCRGEGLLGGEEAVGGQVVPEANAVEDDDYLLDLAGATLITLDGSFISVMGG
jgi:hypothetical protein